MQYRQQLHASIMTLTSPCIVTGHSPDKRTGYVNATLNGKTVLRHRLEYCRHNNVKLADIKGKVVMHLCDNPACVNPQHLQLGTQSDNICDMYRKARNDLTARARGENVNTAKLTADTVREILRTPIKFTSKQLAEKYGVSESTIMAVRAGRTWKHIYKEVKMK